MVVGSGVGCWRGPFVLDAGPLVEERLHAALDIAINAASVSGQPAFVFICGLYIHTQFRKLGSTQVPWALEIL